MESLKMMKAFRLQKQKSVLQLFSQSQVPFLSRRKRLTAVIRHDTRNNLFLCDTSKKPCWKNHQRVRYHSCFFLLLLILHSIMSRFWSLQIFKNKGETTKTKFVTLPRMQIIKNYELNTVATPQNKYVYFPCDCVSFEQFGLQFIFFFLMLFIIIIFDVFIGILAMNCVIFDNITYCILMHSCSFHWCF